MSAVTNTESRVERFKQEIAELRGRTSGGGSERAAGILGIILMVAGIVIAAASYVQATNEGVGRGSTNEILIAQMNQNQEIILAVVGLAMVVIGAALHVRVTLVRFWRFWMLRHLYEGQAHLEEILEAIRSQG
ncbi:MAG: hypothetical protein C4344_00050 [Acidimicrobiia bacterium]